MARRLFASLLLVLVGRVASGAPAGNPTDEAGAIIDSILRVCQTRGMLACEPQIRNVPQLFDYIRLFNEVDALDGSVKEYIRTHYSQQSGGFEVLGASLSLKLDITFKPGAFTGNLASAAAVPGGFDVITPGGDTIQLRKEGDSWVSVLPSSMADQFSKLRPLYVAGQLKRSILIYRTLEAEIAHLSRDDFESNISQDMAPLVVAVLGKDKFPALLRWMSRDLNDVLAFYAKFETKEDMKAHIRFVHHLTG